jgi:hypothetical protein
LLEMPRPVRVLGDIGRAYKGVTRML